MNTNTKTQAKGQIVEANNLNQLTTKNEVVTIVKEVKTVDLIKTELKAVEESFKSQLSTLKADDAKGIKAVEKAKNKAVEKTLINGFHGLFNLVDYCKNVGVINRKYSAFAVLSKLSIDAVIKAGFNGRRYTLKAVLKACEKLQNDAVNYELNEIHGQRLSNFVNTLHNENHVLGTVTTVLNSMVNEKFINQDKCSQFVAFMLGIYECPMNERTTDLFEAVKIKNAESEKNKEIKSTLWESFKAGEIELIEA